MARLFPLLLAAAPALLFAPAALAQTAIGGAAIIVNDVRGENAGKRARIALGDRVFANQGVQTAAESMAKLVFLDDTNMTLGPTAARGSTGSCSILTARLRTSRSPRRKAPFALSPAGRRLKHTG